MDGEKEDKEDSNQYDGGEEENGDKETASDMDKDHQRIDKKMEGHDVEEIENEGYGAADSPIVKVVEMLDRNKKKRSKVHKK
eukprot:2097316-Ditylum_brightwellii.AAC.1